MPHTKVAFDALESSAGLFKKWGRQPKSLLYVGWRYDCKPWWHDTYCPMLGIEKIGVLEVFPKNHSDLEQQVWSGRYNVQPILGNVMNIGSHVKPKEWDIIFWDHGPEHVTRDQLDQVTPVLMETAGSLLLYCCPWGDWPQGAEDGNEHEIHRNAVSKEQLVNLGLTVSTFGKPGQANEGELIGFHFTSEPELE